MDGHDELERFRQKWQDEVTVRNRGNASSQAADTWTPLPRSGTVPRPDRPPRTRHHDDDNIEGTVDLESPEDDVPRLGKDMLAARRPSTSSKEPETALEHFERALEKESQGSLGESLVHYRKAYRLDDRVDRLYNNEHFPPSSLTSRSQGVNPSSGSAATVPGPAHRSPDGPSSNTVPQLIASFASLPISGVPPPTEADPPPPCPVATIPQEILFEILRHTAFLDISAFVRLSLVCKRLAYLVSTEESIWRDVCSLSAYGFGSMAYGFECDIAGNPLQSLASSALEGHGGDQRSAHFESDPQQYMKLPSGSLPRAQPRHPACPQQPISERQLCHAFRQASLEDAQTGPESSAGAQADARVLVSSESCCSEPGSVCSSPPSVSLRHFVRLDPSLILTARHPTYLATFRHRPRIRFTGVYISTVNYTRPGASSPNSLSWNSPVHVVTYYRYLRFHRDGSLISLLTTSEPPDVVPHLHGRHLGTQSSALPQAVMREARRGRWRLAPPATTTTATAAAAESGPDEANEANVWVETEGPTDAYTYSMRLSLRSARGTPSRNTRLVWRGFWSYNRVTDDWAEFGLKNDRPFVFSRVKSWADA